jgi:hypothetical protein
LRTDLRGDRGSERAMRPLRLVIILLLVLILDGRTDLVPKVSVVGKVADLGFFPLGLYTVPSDGFDEVREAGFNLVQIYHWTQSLDEAKAYLEAADAVGLKVNQNMPDDYLLAGDAFWIEWVTTLSAYDALAWWYLPEEPIYRNRDPDAMARLYEIVHQYDPQHRPVALYFGVIGRFEDWCEMADIIMVGCYPEYMVKPRACMKTWIDAAQKACPSKVVVGVSPFFDSNDFGVRGGHPTPYEARFDAYTALIAGAKGLNWFSYQEGAYLTELWQGLHGIVRELNELGPVLLSPDIQQMATANIISGPAQSPRAYGYTYGSIQVLEKQERGEAYLFASNLAEDTVVVEFSGLSPDILAVDVLYEGRRIPVSGGSFRDTFAAADVHVYYQSTSATRSPLTVSGASFLPAPCVMQ